MMLSPRTITAVIYSILLSVSFFTTAQAADSPAVVEGFGCNFREGKDINDLDKAVDYYKAQRGKIDSPELQKMGSVVWVPYRGNVAVDFVWINNNMTLNGWGKSNLAFESSKVGQATQEKFDEVADCVGSGLSTTELLFSTDEELADDDEVLIESYRCHLRPGKTMADSDAAIAKWRPVMEKAVKATNAATVVFRRLPIISGAGYDLSYVAVWDDTAAYAMASSAFLSNPANTRSGELFAAAHSCVSAMFKGRIVVPWDN
jgi:hypothetical protein